MMRHAKNSIKLHVINQHWHVNFTWREMYGILQLYILIKRIKHASFGTKQTHFRGSKSTCNIVEFRFPMPLAKVAATFIYNNGDIANVYYLPHRKILSYLSPGENYAERSTALFSILRGYGPRG